MRLTQANQEVFLSMELENKKIKEEQIQIKKKTELERKNRKEEQIQIKKKTELERKNRTFQVVCLIKNGFIKIVSEDILNIIMSFMFVENKKKILDGLKKCIFLRKISIEENYEEVLISLKPENDDYLIKSISCNLCGGYRNIRCNSVITRKAHQEIQRYLRKYYMSYWDDDEEDINPYKEALIHLFPKNIFCYCLDDWWRQWDVSLLRFT